MFGLDVIALGSGMGLSLPLTFLAIAVLVRLDAAPLILDRIAESQPWIMSWPVIGICATLFAFEVISSKTKVTKTVKHAYDVALMFLKPLAAAMLVFGAVRPGLGTVGWAVALALISGAVSALIHLVRFMVDLLVWISPVPFIDALISGAGDAYCAAMVLLLAFAPGLAMALTLVQIVVALVALRYLFRRVRSAFGRGAQLFGLARPAPASA